MARPRLAALGPFLAFAIACLGACAAPAGALQLPPGFRNESVFDGMEAPTALAFAPDGRVFVAEKGGQVVVFSDLEDDTPTLFADLARDVYNRQDRGLLGMVLDPGFDAGRPYVYLLYTYDHILGATGPEGKAPRWGDPDNPLYDDCPGSAEGVDDCPVSGRLVRLTAVGDQAALDLAGEVAQKVLVEDWCAQDSSHTIGDLGFDAAGDLYASGGDGASFINADYGQFGWPQKNQCGDPPGAIGAQLSPPTAEGGALRSQDLRTLADPTGLDGSIIRIDPDTGLGVEGNPRYGKGPDANAERVIAYGFRNPFRFALDTGNQEIYTGNVGWDTWEEIDRLPLIPGTFYNSGWPCYEGAPRNPVYEGIGLNVCNGLYAEPAATTAPYFSYKHKAGVIPGDDCFDAAITGSAISGVAVYPSSGPFPDDYRNALFFADSVRGCFYVAFPGPDGRPDASTMANFMSQGGEYAGIDLEVGPDGSLYYAKLDKDPGEAGIRRISFDPDAPFARIAADKTFGPLNLKVGFDGSASSDPQSGALDFEWDLDGDGAFDDSPLEKPTFTYTTASNRTVSLRVEDPDGNTSVDKLVVYPGDTPPTVAIAEPLASATWGVGEQVAFAGHADDDEEPGGEVPSAGLRWTTRVLHCPAACHEHPYQGFSGVAGGTLVAPDHDFPSFISITLTATDARGLTAAKTVEIEARGVTMQIVSSPPGITLGAGPESAPGPFGLTAVEGSAVTLSAPSSAQVGGRTLFFEGWSDGGAQVHSVAASPATYTARFGPPDGPPRPRPWPKLLRHPAKRSASTTARFGFHLAGEGVTYRCRLDAGLYASCRSPRVYRNLTSRLHAFRVIAVGADGRAFSRVRTFKWRVLDDDG